MAASLIGRIVGRSLRTRVLLLVLAALLVVGAAGTFAFSRILDHLTLQFGTMIAERQVQYDRFRGMEALNRELSLAESLVRSPSLLSWLANENDPLARERGLAEMEHYRTAFADQSVFVVADASGNYYFNDAQNSYGDNPYSYTLDPELERDSWYYATIERREGCYPNVNVDDVLGVTNVWINCIVSDGNRVLGMVGTGIDLSDFIAEVVDLAEPGIESIFVDQSGAVQAHRDASLVEFRSITKDLADKTTVFGLLDTPAAMAQLRSLMTGARQDPSSARTAVLNMGGEPRLVGVGYLDHIDWYNVTVMDLDAIIDMRVFWPIAMGVATLVLAIALALSWVFRVVVLSRLEKVEAGLVALREGRRATMVADPSNDEIGRLSRTLIEMSDTITEARLDLETQVRQRTEQLQSLVNLDDLTKILNRRGFEERFHLHRRRERDPQQTSGLMLIDIDNFKTVNDTSGHAAGDQVVVEVARRLSMSLRSVDVCARWGGDEFIVLVRGTTAKGINQVADALVSMMAQKPVPLPTGQKIDITISVGAVVVLADDILDVATEMADAALYAAKEGGRSRVVVFDRDTTRMAANSDGGPDEDAPQLTDRQSA